MRGHERGRRRFLRRGLRVHRRARRAVADGPEAAVSHVHLPYLRERERMRAAAAEDAELVAALVDGAVAVEALADRERGAVRPLRRDQNRVRARREAPDAGVALGGAELDHAEAVL